MPRNNDSRSGITRRQAIAGGASVSAALLLAGCADDPDLADDDGTGGSGGNGGNGGSDDGGVVDQLNVTQQVAPVEWDPIVLNDAYSEQIIHTVYDGLYEYDVQTLDPQPKIAAAEPEIERDGTRFIVPLREEPEFHDGTPVTAEDVVHTFMAPIEEQTDNMPDVAMIESAEALDDHTVQFDLEFPYGAFTEMTLARNVVHAEARQEDPEAYNTENPIGSGPYQFDDAVIGEFADVTLWEDYWDEPSQIPSIRWEPAEDDAGRVSRMLARETDVMEGIPPADWEDIDAEDGITIEDTPDTGVFYLAFNCNEGPTADPDVRRAIAHCHSTGAYVDDVIGEAGQNINYPVAPTIGEEWDFPLDEWNDMEYEFDPDYARELLDGSDAIEEGEEIHFISPPDDLRQQWCELVADRLNEIGYGGTVERLDWDTFLSTYDTGDADDYNVYSLGWTGGADPDMYLYQLFHRDNEGVTQGHYYDNDEFHDKIAEARQTVDFDTRRQLYIEATEEILEECVWVPGWNTLSAIAVDTDRVDGVLPDTSTSTTPRLDVSDARLHD
ncbi:ABC transporter substrate-binding protein [Halorubrum sp. JWXQ-INN 858]|uniref:ABC transporter substrate-binding protein n=1 Tax=Halorubrum sp. JWXQ-INN 858 TaxID=2690782 RepID=UPI00135677D2|nr:ABC transporter substrate-binding protein [Halorubrum sp. JWXQ-INN 858]MWV66008.1 ABC transporter substrate-binding protein [Halorubrum sp. JWXQ-INN 858]